MDEMKTRIRRLASLVGNTPLLEISFSYKGRPRVLYAKAEYFNVSGSIKDRVALHVVAKAYETGKLKPGYTIAEATSGNTGIAFSAIGSAMGHPVNIFMPEWMSEERKSLIRSYGADIRLVSREEGGFRGSIRMTEELAAKDDTVFLPCQFSNEDNTEAHYRSTGPEIWEQLSEQGLVPDAFVAGVGTGGTVMGTGKFLKEKNPAIKVHALEPANSPTLSTGHKVGKHRIEGISDEFIPPIVRLDELDEVISVDDGDAILMAQKLAKMGIGVGISSGANFIGALIAQERLGSDSVVVTIFSDDNKKYLSTDLMKKEPVKSGFHSPDIELVGIRAIKRSCAVCRDSEECVETTSECCCCGK
jgi:cysteine synthase A